MRNLLIFATLVTAVFSSTATTCGQTSQNGYYPYVIARGQDRAMIRNMPIEERPTRPLHVYGNTVRRNMYRQEYIQPGLLPTARPFAGNFVAPVRIIAQPIAPRVRAAFAPSLPQPVRPLGEGIAILRRVSILN